MDKRVRLYALQKGNKWVYLSTVQGVTRKRKLPRLSSDATNGAVTTVSRNDAAHAIMNRRRQGFTASPIMHLGDI